ncbi:MAG: hypothetical protein AAB914_02525, partial [Patescibacteria group bacterium]
MQNEPEKTRGNYNEIQIDNPRFAIVVVKDDIERVSEEQAEYRRRIVRPGLELVDSKVNEILGDNNRLADGCLTAPKIMFMETDPDHPARAGYFSPSENKIALIMGKIGDNPLSATKVFIHEYLHFLSHNGRDDYEQIDMGSPVAQRNNVGFRRHFSLDIRKGKEGKITHDYFLSFNEAVTEQLAIDILPGVHETYDDYRGLLGQVIDDGVATKLGSKNEKGEFVVWSKEQFKDYIYTCFFTGDLAGFTDLLKTVYAEFDISEQQFGLMTNKDDLPSVIVKKLKAKDPKAPPPSVGEMKMLIQDRIDSKTPDDYVTDIINPDPANGDSGIENKYGKEYDEFIKENKIAPLPEKEIIGGEECTIDNMGYIIYSGELAESLLGEIKEELDGMLVDLKSGKINKGQVTEHMDELLFKK